MNSRFCGEIEHSIDAKGRLFVPSKFREKLGHAVVAARGFDQCVYLYDMDRWEKVCESFDMLPMTNPKARQMKRSFMAGATELSVDSQGRIILPEALLKYASISKDIVTVGYSDKLEIWSKEIYCGSENVVTESLSDIAEEMGNLGFDIQF